METAQGRGDASVKSSSILSIKRSLSQRGSATDLWTCWAAMPLPHLIGQLSIDLSTAVVAQYGFNTIRLFEPGRSTNSGHDLREEGFAYEQSQDQRTPQTPRPDTVYSSRRLQTPSIMYQLATISRFAATTSLINAFLETRHALQFFPMITSSINQSLALGICANGLMQAVWQPTSPPALTCTRTRHHKHDQPISSPILHPVTQVA